LKHLETIQGRYYDSIKLMRISESLQKVPGVESAAVMMGTPMNLSLLREQGFDSRETAEVGPDDVVVALELASTETLPDARATLNDLLSPAETAKDNGQAKPASLRSPRIRESPRLVMVAVPGRYAAIEAWDALDRGAHAFLFSDNVPIDDEIALKTAGIDRDLLVMGPDCGTAILNGVGLGFANRVRPGTTGLVGGSGTGLQQVSCLVDELGGGVSEAVGTGSRDLSEAIGGVMTLAAIDMLARDPEVERIGLVSKAPHEPTARRVLEHLARCGKPSVACLLGSDIAQEGVAQAFTLEDAARLLQGLAVQEPVPEGGRYRGRLRGIYCGGSLCAESARIAARLGVPAEWTDAGEDRYTVGRAHPMIDPRLRSSMVEQAGDAYDVLLCDVVLGYLAHPDPAGALVPAIREASHRAASRRTQLKAFVALIGTDQDPQELSDQRAQLEDAGAEVFSSNAQAALAAIQSMAS